MESFQKHLLLLLIVILPSCENEAIDTSTITAEDPIVVDSELYNNIERVIDNDSNDELVCLDFDYAFTLYIFDENLEYVGLQILSSDQEFSDFLGSLIEGYSISISYPISYTTDAGDTIIITNNDELKAVIDPCIEFEIIEECNGLLTQDECIWRVINNPDGNNDYEGAAFNVSSAGITSLIHNGVPYFGTWFSFAIELQLHININLNSGGEVADDWNKNWKTTIIDESNMKLESGDDVYFIQRECVDINRNKYIFEECASDGQVDTAEFDLDSYVESFTNDIDISNSTVTFYESIIDMENGINPLISPFSNSENPQFIYVRIEDNSNGNTTFVTIQIVAILCSAEGD
jgi:hypothetical protein